jgi:pyruvate kinase
MHLSASMSTTGSDRHSESIEWLSRELLRIREAMLSEERRREQTLTSCTREAVSRANLLHYMALRHHDIRPLQRGLESLGLSSLGRAEAHALATIDAVLNALRRLGARHPKPTPSPRAPMFDQGRDLLAAHTEGVLGPAPKARSVRIMVTFPSQAATDYAMVREMIASGMNVARINCAHDDASAWSRMIDNVERASRELARPCRVVMDLAGPKLRTGAVAAGPRVSKLSPHRDSEGRVLAPARVLLCPAEGPRPDPGLADAVLVVASTWLAELRAGDRIRFEDMRGKERELCVAAPVGSWWMTDAVQTAYVGPKTVLQVAARAEVRPASLVDIPAVGQKLKLRPDDRLVLTRDQAPGQPAGDGPELSPARIGCSLPHVLPRIQQGHRIWFDDGKIGGIVISSGRDEVTVRITQAKASGSSLGADKGINLPDTDLGLPFLSEKDRADLHFVARRAAVLGLSYVQKPDDLLELSRELESIQAPALSIVLKIETRPAFEHLPDLLLTALERWPVGVMIARGDLAIEMGYERLAEIQEEILWISEAAHVPVIWATAVLDTLAKTGTPSRAEITDAAMSQRAECVMLNKGPHVVKAIRVLDDILQRMEAHQRKKTSFLRPLQVSNLLS